MFASGEYINKIAARIDGPNDLLTSLTFTKSDGSVRICGNDSIGTPLPEQSATYLIGIDGHFDQYLERVGLKVMPESDA